MKTKLSRSRTNRMFCGVCGGLGEYLQIDPVIIRIAFVLMALGHGSGVLIYLIMCLVMPEPETTAVGTTPMHAASSTQARATIGVLLMIVGAVFLGQNLNIVALRWLDADVVWPLLLICGGFLLLRRHTGDAPDKGGASWNE